MTIVRHGRQPLPHPEILGREPLFDFTEAMKARENLRSIEASGGFWAYTKTLLKQALARFSGKIDMPIIVDLSVDDAMIVLQQENRSDHEKEAAIYREMQEATAQLNREGASMPWKARAELATKRNLLAADLSKRSNDEKRQAETARANELANCDRRLSAIDARLAEIGKNPSAPHFGMERISLKSERTLLSAVIGKLRAKP